VNQSVHKSVLLLLDFQQGVGDLAYAHEAVGAAAVALDAGRQSGLFTVFSKVAFRPGYPEISASNLVFSAFKQKKVPEYPSDIISALSPLDNEVVVEKRRFSAFSGNDLHLILRAQGITDLVLCGLSTSGVILSTFSAASDEDYSLTILSDACADPKPTLHQELMSDLFPRSARVVTVKDWTTGLKG